MLISKQRCRRSCLVRTLDNCCERHAIFNRLIGALSEMGKHRMSSITEKSQSSPGPGRKRLAVIQGPPEGCLHLLQELLDTRVPAGEFPPQDVEIAGSRPRFLHLLVSGNEAHVVDQSSCAHWKGQKVFGLAQPHQPGIGWPIWNAFEGQHTAVCNRA